MVSLRQHPPVIKVTRVGASPQRGAGQKNLENLKLTYLLGGGKADVPPESRGSDARLRSVRRGGEMPRRVTLAGEK